MMLAFGGRVFGDCREMGCYGATLGPFCSTHAALSDDKVPGAVDHCAGIEATHVGWDGRSDPIIELRAPCGCSWTGDGRARLRVCAQALAEAHAAAPGNG